MGDLASILCEARRFNAEPLITGVLLHHDGSFMQCFEVPSQAVAAVYDRIRRRRQHTGIVEMLDEPVSRPSLEGFDRGPTPATASDLLALSTARWTRQQPPRSKHADVASAGLFLLRTFWQRGRHR